MKIYYYYSASSSPLLPRGAPDSSTVKKHILWLTMPTQTKYANPDSLRFTSTQVRSFPDKFLLKLQSQLKRCQDSKNQNPFAVA